jgi:hypothetical protein
MGKHFFFSRWSDAGLDYGNFFFPYPLLVLHHKNALIIWFRCKKKAEEEEIILDYIDEKEEEKQHNNTTTQPNRTSPSTTQHKTTQHNTTQFSLFCHHGPLQLSARLVEWLIMRMHLMILRTFLTLTVPHFLRHIIKFFF